MKVLWITNVVLPVLCDEFQIKRTKIEGWLDGMLSNLQKKKDIQVGVCCPIKDLDKMKDGVYNNINYYSFHFIKGCDCDPSLINRFVEIYDLFEPDIIHIWGTEFLHTYEAVRAAEKKKILPRVLINIQGFVSVYAYHFLEGVPERYWSIALEESTSLIDQKDNFVKRGLYEKKAILLCQNICGRTEWDKVCSLEMNPSITYYKCGETLRAGFYKNIGKWNENNIIPHSIFLSQAYYPIKGLHLFLQGLKLLLRYYPDTKVYIGGSGIGSSYGVFINELVVQLGLADCLEYLGPLSENEMIEWYKKANVFVCPSLIENSSNSICEAMLIGTPIVASYVGGTADLINHEAEGLLYPCTEYYMMAHYIMKYFTDLEYTKRISQRATMKANELVNPYENAKKLIEIYHDIEQRENQKCK